MHGKLKGELSALHANSITWGNFYQRTRADWRRLAASEFRRWRLPQGVEVEDIEQQLLTEAAIALGKYKPDVGSMCVGRYVIWCAVAETRHWIHAQRNAHRRSAHSPSRIEVAFSLMLDNDAPALEVPNEADQETGLDEFQHLRLAMQRLDLLEQQLLYVFIAHASIDGAAEEVFAQPQLSRALRIDSICDARARVRRVVELATAA